MALDGALLSQLAHEIHTTAEEARIDRIAQPYRDEIILHLRWRGGTEKLLLSANASNPRLHFTDNIPENPQNPPMFCMLLRKHLAGARLIDVRQQGMDRIVYLDFEALNELGDTVTLTLVHEIMGRHSNLILINQEGMILDAIKRVGFETSTVRQVLPNIRYHLPPGQDKLDLRQAPMEEILQRMQQEEGSLSRGIMNSLEGMSPLPSREVAFLATADDPALEDLSEEHWVSVEQALKNLKQLLLQHTGQPTILLESDGHPRDFTFLPIAQYGEEMENERVETYSQLLDSFYFKRHTAQQMRQLSADLHKHVKNIHDRILRRLAAQKEELLATQDRDELRIQGELLTANIYALSQGATEATLENFYGEEGEKVTISLDPQLSPAENAQAYFSRYRKADTAEKILTQLIQQGTEELAYIETVQDALERATGASELAPIREELIEEGYLRKKAGGRRQKPAKVSLHSYFSSDGFSILAGRNNKQNEQLTLRTSQKHDIWLHSQNIPGSHVIIVTNRQPVPERTLEEAAMIAAYHSQAGESTNVPVDYTEIRHVRKQSGGKPGMVIYDHHATLFVTPDEKKLQTLEQKK